MIADINSPFFFTDACSPPWGAASPTSDPTWSTGYFSTLSLATTRGTATPIIGPRGSSRVKLIHRHPTDFTLTLMHPIRESSYASKWYRSKKWNSPTTKWTRTARLVRKRIFYFSPETRTSCKLVLTLLRKCDLKIKKKAPKTSPKNTSETILGIIRKKVLLFAPGLRYQLHTNAQTKMKLFKDDDVQHFIFRMSPSQ